MGWAAGTPLAGRPVDVVFVGSCTNARLSDLRLAAGILRGRRVHTRVRMLVVPGPEPVPRDAHHQGIDAAARPAGAECHIAGWSLVNPLNCNTVTPGKLR